MTARSKWSFFKSFLYCVILIGLFLSAYIGFDQLRLAANLDHNIPLSKFVIGKWDGQRQVTDPKGDYLITYEIEFIDERKFSFHVITPGHGYEEEFTYQFISNNTIQVQGRREATVRKWKLARIGEKLELCFEKNPCVILTRKKTEWWWIVIILVAVVLAFYLLKKFTVSSASQSSIPFGRDV